MSMLPAASLGSSSQAPARLNPKDSDRERALLLIFAVAALAVGALAGVASSDVSAFAGGLLLIVLAAWTLPVAWLGPLLAALIPFQFYLPVPATSFTLRIAFVFTFAVTVRIIVDQQSSSFVFRRSSGACPERSRRVFRPEFALSGACPEHSRRAEGSFVQGFAWLLPAGLFLLAALIGALGAQDRYAAFKGTYDWLVVLLSAFMVAALRPSTGTARWILFVLIAGGIAQAVLGLLQYLLGLTMILQLLRLPVSALFYQPNLLRDKLGDLSFNWVAFDRALPFGTFINGIDYAVFLAAIFCLILGFLVASVPTSERGAKPVTARSREAAKQSPILSEITTAPVGAPNDTVPCQQSKERLSAVIGRRSFAALAVGAALIAVALLLTFKGSGFLALMGGMAAIAVFSLSRLSARTVALGLVVLIGAFVVALPFADLIGQRALFLVQREQGSAGSVGRLQTWISLVQFVAQRPLFGYGLNNAIALISPQWTLRDGALGFVFSTPESAYVSALVETGLVGFVALVGWLSTAVVQAFQRARAAKEPALYIGMVAALLALVFGNITVSGLTTDQNGMLLGMLIGLIYGSQRDDRDQV